MIQHSIKASHAPKRKYRIDVVFGDKKLNELMSAFDLNPKYKAFATSQSLQITVSDGSPMNDIFGKLVFELRKRYVVVLVVCEELGLRWQDKSIKEVSNGKHVYFIN